MIRDNELVAKALKPFRVVAENYRGAQLWALAGASATVRAHAEHHVVRDYTVATSLLPAGTIVGDALVIVVSGSYPYSVGSIMRGRFCGSGPGSDQAGAVARGEFFPGHVDYSLTNESEYWP